MKKNRILALLLSSPLLAACGDSDEEGGHHHEDHDPFADVGAHACHHAAETPVPVEAGADPASAATAVSASHQAFAVQLPEVEGARFGAVLFTPPADGEFAILLGADVPLAILDGETPVEIEASVPVNACPDLLEKAHVADFVLGRQYTLVFGPTDVAAVLVLAERVEHGEEHAH